VRAQESKNETLSDKFFFVGAFIFMPRNVAAHHSPPARSTPLASCTPRNPGIQCLILANEVENFGSGDGQRGRPTTTTTTTTDDYGARQTIIRTQQGKVAPSPERRRRK